MVGKLSILGFIFLFNVICATEDVSRESNSHEAYFEPIDYKITENADVSHNQDSYVVAEDFIDDYDPENPQEHYAEENVDVYEGVPEQTLDRRIGGRRRNPYELCCTPVEAEERLDIDHEPRFPPQVGSLRGVPGVDYPDYKEIPLTSFNCAGRKTPGFYADLETRCQVFHVCYPHRRESFLCPIGTIFNQPIMACDYWYNGNCSASEQQFHIEEEIHVPEEIEDLVSVIVDEIAETAAPTLRPDPVPTPKPKPTIPPTTPPQPESFSAEKVVSVVTKFIPVKAKVITRVTVPVPALPKTRVVLSAAKPRVHIKAKPVPMKPLPVATMVKTSFKPVKTAAFGGKVLVGKAKLAAPIAKPLAVKAAIKAKAAKVAAVPAISLITKKHLAAAILKMLQGHQNPYGYHTYGY